MLALDLEAARRRYRVSFVRTADLVRELLDARDEQQLAAGTVEGHKTRLVHDRQVYPAVALMQAAQRALNLLSGRCERCSTVVTSNLAFSEWVQVFGDAKLTTALLDRLAHHAQVLTTKGGSYHTGTLRPREGRTDEVQQHP